MDIYIVPCTEEKVWSRDRARGATAAKDAYTDRRFSEWRHHVEATGHPWYVLSTRYGLLAPDDVVPGPYNVPISAAIRDGALLEKLREQGRHVDFSRAKHVYVMEWDRFLPLVNAAVNGAAPVKIMTLQHGRSR